MRIDNKDMLIEERAKQQSAPVLTCSGGQVHCVVSHSISQCVTQTTHTRLSQCTRLRELKSDLCAWGNTLWRSLTWYKPVVNSIHCCYPCEDLSLTDSLIRLITVCLHLHQTPTLTSVTTKQWFHHLSWKKNHAEELLLKSILHC